MHRDDLPLYHALDDPGGLPRRRPAGTDQHRPTAQRGRRAALGCARGPGGAHAGAHAGKRVALPAEKYCQQEGSEQDYCEREQREGWWRKRRRRDFKNCPGSRCGAGAERDVTTPQLFAGDTLFAGSIGRTDLWGGSMEQIMESLRGKLMQLPDDTRVHPGHGPATTIGEERHSNPFLRKD